MVLCGWGSQLITDASYGPEAVIQPNHYEWLSAKADINVELRGRRRRVPATGGGELERGVRHGLPALHE